MSDKRYLLYLDILGFEKLALEIASRKGMDPRVVREHFVNVIKERVATIEAKGRIVGKHHGADDWLLVIDSSEKVFQSILAISEHHTGYTGYESIPLEMAVDLAEFDKWANFEEETLITQEASIEFLKTHIVEHYRHWYKETHNGQSTKSAFVILTESAHRELEPFGRGMYDPIEYEGARFFVVDISRVQEKGRVFEFLDKIGHPGSRLYDSIDNLYVPPLEYPDIERTLKEERIVFITGTQEYGKTYTAVKLMWEYYRRGYEPRWIKGNEEYERVRGRERLEEIRAELKPKHIIYFEDPFGKTRYEKRESLEREIGVIVDFVAQVDDAYVLITSREEVFKEFEKEKISAREIQEFEQKLNIRKPSYDYEKRKAMVVQWANKENCQWLRNAKLEDLILHSLWDERLLPTPLSIRDFALTTVNIQAELELIDKITEKSVETEWAFAREIEAMAEDKVVFLFFPFIGHFRVQCVRQVYQRFVKQLHLENAWEFDRVVDWFKDDKVKITGYFGGSIEFSHPTYYQAVEHLLTEEEYATGTKRQLFTRLLVKLAEEEEAASAVAWTIYGISHTLPADIKNRLLVKLAEKDEAAESVAMTIASNFDELPKYVRDLLFKLAEKDAAAKSVAWATEDNFDKLPENVRNELLVKLAEKGEAAESVAWTIAGNFDKLPKHVRNLLFMLAEKDEAVDNVAAAIADNLDKLPADARNELLVGLAEADEAAWNITQVMANNVDKLPEDVRNILLIKGKRIT